MKLDSTSTSPAGHPVLMMRIGRQEAEILRSLLHLALQRTPRTEETSKAVQRMQAMSRTLGSNQVKELLQSFPDDK